MTRIHPLLIFAVVLSCFEDLALAADPWADRVVSYLAGSGITNDFVTNTPFNDPTVSLGEPTRFTSDVANFGGPTTPLQASFRSDEIVTIGKGGSLTVAFDEAVTNDPNNPFGIDLIVFGNSFLFGSTIFNEDFTFNPAGTVDGVAAEGGIMELSSDGVNFVVVPNLAADGLYPTLAYTDLDDPFPTIAGTSPTDFTKPVDPDFDVTGKTYAEVIAGYQGAGGGTGIDIGALGLQSVTHVRVSNPANAQLDPEIDAFADVAPLPEPTTASLIGIAAWMVLQSRQLRKHSST